MDFDYIHGVVFVVDLLMYISVYFVVVLIILLALYISFAVVSYDE